MNAQQLIDAQPGNPGGMQFMAWRPKVVAYLTANGCTEADIPKNPPKDELLPLLEKLAEKERPVAPAPVAPPAGAVEVNLFKTYCPRWLLDEDGEWIEQDSRQSTQTVPAGLALLKAEEAERVLARGQGEVTPNTFRQMRG